MAAGMVLSAVQTLLAAVQCTSQLKELSSMFGYKSQLENLESTVKMIKAVLLEAETKNQELTHEGRVWFEDLKDAVYDADDFFDELNTKAQLKKLSQKKILKKVRRFLSLENQLVSAFHTSQKIKMFREKLDGIANNRIKFGFSGEYKDYKPVKRREETYSYVFETDVIGREAEKEAIVGMLLSDLTSSGSTHGNVSFVSIVGIGGMGKTTLSQLVFNDKRIKDRFGRDLYWVCVSEEFGLEEIFRKLLNKKSSDFTLEYLQQEVRKMIEGKMFLLVLDDVWEESHLEWLNLKNFLCSGGVGSRVLVTTRSKEVAKVVDKNLMFELKGLSDESSWHLFERIAFGEGHEHNQDSRLVEIGKHIVKKCANVPLSIKVTSSMLFKQEISRWEAFENMDLPNMPCYGDSQKDSIMTTLMFSYYNLTPALKSCFSFCSLFPKDYTIERQMLISLWLAEGYLVPRNEGESMEAVGEDYFLILLQRCFFQDIQLDENDEIHYCKMHDLMHDLALKVAGKESLTLMASSTIALENKFRHLSVTRDALIDSLYNKDCPSRQTLRTFVHFYRNSSSMNVNFAALVSNFRRLRVLHLKSSDMELCHDELGKLLHLRYLRICYNSSLKFLPRSITKLHNLQILYIISFKNLIELPHSIGKLVNLRILGIHECSQLTKLPEGIGNLVNLKILEIYRCGNLTELPKDIGNLVSLRILKIHECLKLTELPKDIEKLVNLKELDICNDLLLRTLKLFKINGSLILKFSHFGGARIIYMPVAITKLRNLHTLTYFVVGGDSSLKVQNGELIDLKDLNIRGLLRIVVLGISPSSKLNSTKGAHILKNARLKGLEIFCESAYDQGEFHETLLEGLSPNNELEILVMRGYKGKIFPNWGEGKVTFPSSIVNMVLAECVGLKHLSSLSKLINLKFLCLSKMENLEYIEKDEPDDLSKAFFLSLEILNIEDAKNLKGWWRNITWNEKGAEGGSGCLVDANNKCVELLPPFTRLRDLKITNCESLKYFPPCPHLKKLKLERVNEALHFCVQRNNYLKQNLVTNTTLSTSTSSSYLFCLEELTLSGVDEFYNSLFLRGRIGNFTNLKTLNIIRCENIETLEEDDDKPWKSLTSLSSLVLWSLSSLEKLPEDFQHLSSLQSLEIKWCENLQGLGESIGSLTSLKSLDIWVCPKLKSLPEAMRRLTSLTELYVYKPSSELKERCQEPNGEDWPKIRHIPKLSIYG